jgi:hypothetical protein
VLFWCVNIKISHKEGEKTGTEKNGYAQANAWSREGAEMNNHKKKMVAPILITILVVLYYVLYFGFIISYLDGILKFLLGIIPLVLSAVMIYVCVQRINEIKGGEEDDLSQY